MNVWRRAHELVLKVFSNRDLEDDVVSKGVKVRFTCCSFNSISLCHSGLIFICMQDFCFALSSCIILWLLSFVLVMLQVIEHGRFLDRNVLLFIPMWIGSLVGIVAAIVISLKICNNVWNYLTPFVNFT